MYSLTNIAFVPNLVPTAHSTPSHSDTNSEIEVMLDYPTIETLSVPNPSIIEYRYDKLIQTFKVLSKPESCLIEKEFDELKKIHRKTITTGVKQIEDIILEYLFMTFADIQMTMTLTKWINRPIFVHLQTKSVMHSSITTEQLAYIYRIIALEKKYYSEYRPKGPSSILVYHSSRKIKTFISPIIEVSNNASIPEAHFSLTYNNKNMIGKTFADIYNFYTERNGPLIGFFTRVLYGIKLSKVQEPITVEESCINLSLLSEIISIDRNNINALDFLKQSIFKKSPAAALLVLQIKGLDINQKISDDTALREAVVLGLEDIVAMLLLSSNNPLMRSDQLSSSPTLQEAIEWSKKVLWIEGSLHETFSHLIESNPSQFVYTIKSLCNTIDQTKSLYLRDLELLLHDAIIRGFLKIVKMLLRFNVDLLIKINNKDALELAKEMSNQTRCEENQAIYELIRDFSRPVCCSLM